MNIRIVLLFLCIGTCAIASAQPNNPILKMGDPGFLYTADPATEVFDGKVSVCCLHDQPAARGFNCDRE